MSKLGDVEALAEALSSDRFPKDEAKQRLKAFNKGRRPKPESSVNVRELVEGVTSNETLLANAISTVASLADWKRESKGKLGVYQRNAELLALLSGTRQHEIYDLLRMSSKPTNKFVEQALRWLAMGDKTAREAAKEHMNKLDPMRVRYGAPSLGNMRLFELLESVEEDADAELSRLIGDNPKGLSPAGRVVIGANVLARRLDLELESRGGNTIIGCGYESFEPILQIAESLGHETFCKTLADTTQSLDFYASSVMFATKNIKWDEDEELWAGTELTRCRRKLELGMIWKGDWWDTYPNAVVDQSRGKARGAPKTGKLKVKKFKNVDQAKEAVTKALNGDGQLRQQGGQPLSHRERAMLTDALKAAISMDNVAYVSELIDRGATLSEEDRSSALQLLERRQDSPRILALLRSNEVRN